MGSDEQEPQLTEEESREYLQQLGGLSMGKEAGTIFGFLQDVIKEEDNTKIGNVTEEELGRPTHPVRSCFDLANFCSIIKDPNDSNDLYGLFEQRFNFKGQNALATGDSKDGFLIAVGQTKKSIMKRIGTAMKSGGWFSRKKPETDMAMMGVE